MRTGEGENTYTISMKFRVVRHLHTSSVFPREKSSRGGFKIKMTVMPVSPDFIYNHQLQSIWVFAQSGHYLKCGLWSEWAEYQELNCNKEYWRMFTFLIMVRIISNSEKKPELRVVG